uniref:PD-(D/E)XK nuclease family transposase n=1 Tax=Candidatus Kentrum sp. TUN TaxID=2126343 RepID=A0A451ACV0_9GAMM|nr:MAG: PD-(D/E)XK nuclease family transposase [Candidatus Kentron sp. TUN]
MQIANPIYDVVFKHLMQNNEIAILILSAILEEEILSLNLLPQETAIALENRSFTVYRLDFAALIKTSDGEEKHVVIEIQKAKFAADIMRFRRYLGEQYKKGFPVEGSKVPKATPIISIYFLGYRLDHVTAPVIKVLRRYYDAATGKELPAREEFIESLTHDSFVIQIPYLGAERKTATERLLAIFDQHRKVNGDEHILDIDEEMYPKKYRQVIRWLNRAVSEPAIRRTMDVEDEILAELEDMERRIAGMGKSLKEKDKVLEEKDKVLEENAKALEENAKALEENAKALEDKDKALAEKDRLIAELRGSQWPISTG